MAGQGERTRSLDTWRTDALYLNALIDSEPGKTLPRSPTDPIESTAVTGNRATHSRLCDRTERCAIQSLAAPPAAPPAAPHPPSGHAAPRRQTLYEPTIHPPPPPRHPPTAVAWGAAPQGTPPLGPARLIHWAHHHTGRLTAPAHSPHPQPNPAPPLGTRAPPLRAARAAVAVKSVAARRVDAAVARARGARPRGCAVSHGLGWGGGGVGGGVGWGGGFTFPCVAALPPRGGRREGGGPRGDARDGARNAAAAAARHATSLDQWWVRPDEIGSAYCRESLSFVALRGSLRRGRVLRSSIVLCFAVTSALIREGIDDSEESRGRAGAAHPHPHPHEVLCGVGVGGNGARCGADHPANGWPHLGWRSPTRCPLRRSTPRIVWPMIRGRRAAAAGDDSPIPPTTTAVLGTLRLHPRRSANAHGPDTGNQPTAGRHPPPPPSERRSPPPPHPASPDGCPAARAGRRQVGGVGLCAGGWRGA